MDGVAGHRPIFEYGPLKHGREFRLVQFGEVQKTGSRSSITCRFSSHPVDQAPTYSTLSYTWGNPGGDETVDCPDNTSLLITSNLATWLRLHGMRLAKEGQLLWIDQLCIDQTNIDERNAQVQIMRDIYKNAVRLFVWIGPESEDSTLALHTIQNAGRVIQDFYEHPRACIPSAKEYYLAGFPPPGMYVFDISARYTNHRSDSLGMKQAWPT